MSSSRKDDTKTLGSPVIREHRRNPDPLFYHPNAKKSDPHTAKFFTRKSEELIKRNSEELSKSSKIVTTSSDAEESPSPKNK